MYCQILRADIYRIVTTLGNENLVFELNSVHVVRLPSWLKR